MPDLLDAVGELIRQQTLRVHYLADLLIDPTLGRTREVRHQLTTAHRLQEQRAYTVHAPCLLAQLHAAVYASDTGRGGRTIPGSRMPLTAAALDLWVEISVDVNGWAAALGVDRRPYRRPEAERPAPDVRMPEWQRRLWIWSGTDVDEHGVPVPIPPLPARSPTDQRPDFIPAGIPPVGQLLRAVAAAAIAQHADELGERIAYRAHGWAAAIDTMLAGPAAEDHIHPIRGATCDQCGASSTVEDRDGERIVVPAIQVRFLPLDQDQPDDRWAYRICIACGDNGWITYTTTTGEAA